MFIYPISFSFLIAASAYALPSASSGFPSALPLHGVMYQSSLPPCFVMAASAHLPSPSDALNWYAGSFPPVSCPSLKLTPTIMLATVLACSIVTSPPESPLGSAFSLLSENGPSYIRVGNSDMPSLSFSPLSLK